MRTQVVRRQCAKVTVLGEEDPPFRHRLGQHSFVAGIRGPLAYVDDIMASGPHGADSRRDNIGRQARARYSAAIVRPSAAAISLRRAA